jgi:hypothetical protein
MALRSAIVMTSAMATFLLPAGNETQRRLLMASDCKCGGNALACSALSTDQMAWLE